MPAVPSPRPGQQQGSKSKPTLNMTDNAQTQTRVNPSQWLNFSLPPRQTTTGPVGPPRRSRRGDGWRGGAMTRERYVHANFRFVLKPTEMLSYGAHFADPDISLHWPHILQVLVPTFSAFSVAQGYVSSESSSSHHHHHDEDLGRSFDDDEMSGLGEEAAERRRRMEEERRGRMCPICLGKPVAGRMTKCGHIFCFPCILHYIQLSDVPKSAKCPICGDTIYESMLKSVRYLDASTMLAAARGDDEEAPPSLSTYTTQQTHQSDRQEVASDHGIGIVGEMEGFEEAQAVDAVTKGVEPPHIDKKGHRIHMRLIHRPQMTTLALPSAPTWPSESIPPLTAPWHFLPDILTFSRFMLATPDYMISELERELGELRAEWDLLRGDDLGRDFVRAAREKVEKQVGKVKAELMTDLVRRSEKDGRDAWAEAVGGEKLERERKKERERRAQERQEQAERAKALENAGEIPTEFLATSSHSFATHNPNVNIPPNLPVTPNPMPSSNRKSRKRGGQHHASQAEPIPSGPSYWFYQSSLGANVFLHPLDIRILLAHFKSYSLFPPTLSFSSVGFDPGTINDELRKRCKYLGHLPTGTEVIFVEAELEEIVGKEGLVAFEQPLRARREKRRARVKREDKAKSKWEKAEREKMPQSQARTPDREFALALARSTAEMDSDTGGGYQWASEPVLGASASSSASHFGPSPGTSPTTWAHTHAHAQPQSQLRTFASTLSSTAVPSAHRRKENANSQNQPDSWAVDAAWEAFDGLSVQDRGDGGDGSGGVKESERGGGGGGKKGGKKNQKKVLVLGGGGGRRA